MCVCPTDGRWIWGSCSCHAGLSERTRGWGLGDLFDLGGGVGMPMGTYVPPKTVSMHSLLDENLEKQIVIYL